MSGDQLGWFRNGSSRSTTRRNRTGFYHYKHIEHLNTVSRLFLMIYLFLNPPRLLYWIRDILYIVWLLYSYQGSPVFWIKFNYSRCSTADLFTFRLNKTHYVKKYIILNPRVPKLLTNFYLQKLKLFLPLIWSYIIYMMDQVK